MATYVGQNAHPHPEQGQTVAVGVHDPQPSALCLCTVEPFQITGRQKRFSFCFPSSLQCFVFLICFYIFLYV